MFEFNLLISDSRNIHTHTDNIITPSYVNKLNSRKHIGRWLDYSRIYTRLVLLNDWFEFKRTVSIRMNGVWRWQNITLTCAVQGFLLSSTASLFCISSYLSILEFAFILLYIYMHIYNIYFFILPTSSGLWRHEG